MNEIVLTMQQKALEAIKTFESISSYRDLELWLMQGQGLSQNTYRTYMQAVKDFYEHTGGLHPLQWTAAAVEDFYDAQIAKNGLATAYTKIAGIKNICRQIKLRIPFWESPLDIMSEKAKVKIAKTPNGKKKAAMYQKELDAVFHYLRQEQEGWDDLCRHQTFAIILTLVTTGLRAAELCALNREDLEYDSDNDRWYFNGIGKGDRPFRVETHPRAVDEIFRVFHEQFGREPRPQEALFWGSVKQADGRYHRMQKTTLWMRLNKLGAELKREGLIRARIQFSAHLFRRTWATLNLKRGMDMAACADAGRWSNIQTLQKHYADTLRSTRPYTDKIVEAVI